VQLHPQRGLGGLYPFVRVPMHELTNRALDARLLFGTQPEELEQRLFEARADADRVAMLDSRGHRAETVRRQR
jgi:hypothetical protein